MKKPKQEWNFFLEKFKSFEIKPEQQKMLKGGDIVTVDIVDV